MYLLCRLINEGVELKCLHPSHTKVKDISPRRSLLYIYLDKPVKQIARNWIKYTFSLMHFTFVTGYFS